jgi:hypothetical protein
LRFWRAEDFSKMTIISTTKETSCGLSQTELDEWWQNEQKKERKPFDGSVYATTEELDSPFQCYYCDNNFGRKKKMEYDSHVKLAHPGKPAYPDKPDLEKFGLVPQGKSWERLEERQATAAKVLNKFVDDYQFRCYYCDDYCCNTIPCDEKCRELYIAHVQMRHGNGDRYPPFPTEAQIEKLGLKPQDKWWETKHPMFLRSSQKYQNRCSLGTQDKLKVQATTIISQCNDVDDDKEAIEKRNSEVR